MLVRSMDYVCKNRWFQVTLKVRLAYNLKHNNHHIVIMCIESTIKKYFFTRVKSNISVGLGEGEEGRGAGGAKDVV